MLTAVRRTTLIAKGQHVAIWRRQRESDRISPEVQKLSKSLQSTGKSMSSSIISPDPRTPLGKLSGSEGACLYSDQSSRAA